MLRIVFADLGSWDYHVGTVLHQPLGGTHSAACYLAMALADAGQEVFFLSNTRQPGCTHGVHCLAWNACSNEELAALQPDVVIAIHEPAYGLRLRQIFGPTARILAWTGNAYKVAAPISQKLRSANALGALDGVLLASEWQRRHFLEALSYPAERAGILRYAVAPVFENLFPQGQPILPQKSAPPVLAYTSTPFRGLEVLACAFPEIRRRIPGAQLKVFSSMQVYLDTQPWAEHAEFGTLYERLRQIEGVHYCGSVPQPELARHMKDVQVLAYPSIFEETFCISALEAMAAGCQIVTNDYGALPETTSGFADLVPMDRSARTYIANYVEHVVAAIERSRQKPAETEAHLRRQVDFVNEEYSWKHRAAEFMSLVAAFPHAPPSRVALSLA